MLVLSIVCSCRFHHKLGCGSAALRWRGVTAVLPVLCSTRREPALCVGGRVRLGVIGGSLDRSMLKTCRRVLLTGAGLSDTSGLRDP